MTRAADNAGTPSRSISAGSGLTGGGDLSTDLTLSADVATQAEAEEGANSVKLMTPALTRQALEKQTGEELLYSINQTTEVAVLQFDIPPEFTAVRMTYWEFVPTVNDARAFLQAFHGATLINGASDYHTSLLHSWSHQTGAHYYRGNISAASISWNQENQLRRAASGEFMITGLNTADAHLFLKGHGYSMTAAGHILQGLLTGYCHVAGATTGFQITAATSAASNISRFKGQIFGLRS